MPNLAEIDFLSTRDHAIPSGLELSYGDVLLSNSFLKMWTFLCTHGERFIFMKEMDDGLGRKFMHGRCIMQSWHDVGCWTKQTKTGGNQHRVGLYAEGLCSLNFLVLHAWLVLANTRHAYVADRTWIKRYFNEDDVWYQGVVFDKEFFDWVRFTQRSNQYKETLPYLTNGSCCLTYKPLLDGQIDGYRIKDGDQDKALQLLTPFYYALKACEDAKKEISIEEC